MRQKSEWRIQSTRDVAYFVVGIAVLTIALSQLSILIVYLHSGREAFHLEAAIISAFIIPIVISVPISWAIARMSLKLASAQIELQQLANTDPLTGLPNRRSFFSDADEVLEISKAELITSALIVIDADHFKELNDSYGHSVGDKALVKIADVLKDSFRQSDLLCRVGGEEFAVLLPDLDLAAADKLAQRVLENVCNSPICEDGAVIEYSVSCGIADTNTSFDLKKLFKAADDAMYLAKRRGRNRVALINEVAA